MGESDWLAERFERDRPYLRAVAFRMLGSWSEADDAVQDSWLRLSSTDPNGIENLRGWLTTVVGRVCLNMLRSRRSRPEEQLGEPELEPTLWDPNGPDPEGEAVLADSVGSALLVVLDFLAPAERLAFVLHDLFAVPFDEIAPIVGRSPSAVRQLASRARRRVQGADRPSEADVARQRAIVDAFLVASRQGDFHELLQILDPDIVLHADGTAMPSGKPHELTVAHRVARSALMFSDRAQFAQPALVNGAVGIVVAPRGRLFLVLGFTFTKSKIATIDVIADSQRVRQLDLAVLDA